MKTNCISSIPCEEITSFETEAISGGFILLSIVATVAGICAIAYYTGYGVGKLTNCGEK